MKLSLGTVQFGVDYGVSNKSGQVPENEVSQILELAWNSGVHLLDTAPIYGNCEFLLGKLTADRRGWDFITKTPVFTQDRITPDSIAELESALETSLAHLRTKRLYGLLVHHGTDLLKPGAQALIDRLERLRDDRSVERIGVSVYSPEELDAVLARFRPDIVQLPFNVLDQRFLRSGHLRELKTRHIHVIARSAFLQGLLLSDPRAIPAHFDPIRDHLQGFFSAIKTAGLTPLQAALNAARRQSDIDHVLVGVCHASELAEIVHAATHPPASHVDYDGFALSDERYLNPALWPRPAQEAAR